jgi:hypothetical protein
VVIASVLLTGLAAAPMAGASDQDIALTTVQSPPNPVAPGQTVTYTTTIANNGSEPYPLYPTSSDPFLSMFLSKYRSDAAPPNNYISVTPSQGECKRQATNPPSVDCFFGTLQPGATATYVSKVVAQVSMENRIALLRCTSVHDCGTIKVADADTILACVVPKLKGKTLAAAKSALKGSACRLGSVTRRKAGAGKRGRVLAQSPAAGTKLANGGKVALVVGKR